MAATSGDSGYVGAARLLYLVAMAIFLVTIGIVVTLLTEGLDFFREVNVGDFLLGTTWQPVSGEFGVLPLLVASLWIAGIAALGALVARRRLALPLLVTALAAAGIGWWQYGSLPDETGPLLVWWLLPAIAAGSALAALLLGRRLVASALLILAGLELAVWVFVRRKAAFRAIIPTDAPFWLDRGVLAAAAVMAVAASEVAIGLGLIVAMARRDMPLDVDQASALRG